MGVIRSTPLVKLFVGVITGQPGRLPVVETALADRFGPVALRSSLLPFDLTAYYEKEMGTGLVRQFLGFEELIEPQTLAQAKRFTNELEAWIAQMNPGVRRPVNLDPGYVEQGKIVLASTKNHSHRIYLSEGIFAEVTLYYQDKEWRSNPWTFPDYSSGRYHGFFHELRRLYRLQLKTGHPPFSPLSPPRPS
jgi:hypothetical protein